MTEPESSISYETFRNPPSGKQGGHAILFPSVTNDLHALRHDPMPYIREQLAGHFT